MIDRTCSDAIEVDEFYSFFPLSKFSQALDHSSHYYQQLVNRKLLSIQRLHVT